VTQNTTSRDSHVPVRVKFRSNNSVHSVGGDGGRSRALHGAEFTLIIQH